VLLPIAGQREGYFSVLTPCEVRGWVAAADVDVHPRATGVPRSLREATIVVDPGHGGVLTGAIGPSGLPEKEPNADIARRLAANLEGSRVFMTMSGDFNAGLEYRAAIADALSSHVFVSIHNNAEPDVRSEKPGTEIYYQYRSEASKRLAGLLYEEVVGALEPFDADWVADRDAGAKYRLNDQGIDYYGLLRRAEVPAVLVEALFVSNGSEEALLRRPEVREAIAEALASGLKRFFESRDPGSGFVEPYPREPGPSGRLPTECTDPVA
jgi:N-acetylmuramoyl-L-alanine amidase